MNITRRQLLFGAGAAAGTAVLAGAGLATTTGLALAPVQDPSHLTYDLMLRHVGSSFRVHTTAVSKVSVRLAACNDLSTPAANAKPGQCFSAVFEGPGNAAFGQSTYLLDHDALGTMPLFLAPVSARKAGAPVTYEAIVNRLA